MLLSQSKFSIHTFFHLSIYPSLSFPPPINLISFAISTSHPLSCFPDSLRCSETSSAKQIPGVACLRCRTRQWVHGHSLPIQTFLARIDLQNGFSTGIHRQNCLTILVYGNNNLLLLHLHQLQLSSCLRHAAFSEVAAAI